MSVQLSSAVKLPKAMVAHQRPWWLIRGHDGSSKAMMASSIHQEMFAHVNAPRQKFVFVNVLFNYVSFLLENAH